MPGESLQDIYVEQLQDLSGAEHQILEALPRMADAACQTDQRLTSLAETVVNTDPVKE